MSLNVNKVTLAGRLTRDPELRYLPSGAAAVDLGIAINRKWKGKDGVAQEDTCFVDCQAWARAAEVIAEYCHKGDPIYIEGRLKLDSWEGRDGQKRSKLRVVVENFQFLGGRGSAAGTGHSSPPARPVTRQAPQSEEPEDYQRQVDDSIPF